MEKELRIKEIWFEDYPRNNPQTLNRYKDNVEFEMFDNYLGTYSIPMLQVIKDGYLIQEFPMNSGIIKSILWETIEKSENKEV